jgi:ABC-2 type transport system permease protein
LSDALHAEWTKLRLQSNYWLLAGAIALTIALGAAVCGVTNQIEGGSLQDTTKLSLAGVELGQALIAILAVLMISSEYGSGTMSVTLVATPRRLTVLAAKSLLIMGLAAVAGAVSVIGSLLAGRLILGANGFTSAHGYTAVSLLHALTLRAAAGSIVYMALIALFSLGVATVLRDGATSIGVVLSLLYLFPIIAHVVANPSWRRHLMQVGPMTAGLSIESTINLRSAPVGPWSGLGVAAAWAATALATAAVLFKSRDA